MMRPASIFWPLILARFGDVENLVERHDDVLKVLAQAHAEGEKRGGQRAGHGDRLAAERIERDGLAGDDHRPVVVAHAGAAGAEDVLVGQVGVGVQADGGQLQLALEGPAVERFDIDQLVRELEIAGVDLVVRQGVEHEGVVGIGAVADADERLGGGQGNLGRKSGERKSESGLPTNDGARGSKWATRPEKKPQGAGGS